MVKNMNKVELYYTPPEDELFDELKERAIENWKEVDSYDDKFGYATEKIRRIKDIKNVGDNFMYIVAMFDLGNQKLLAEKLSSKTRRAVRIRMLDGGSYPELIYF